jgi:serpin B
MRSFLRPIRSPLASFRLLSPALALPVLAALGLTSLACGGTNSSPGVDPVTTPVTVAESNLPRDVSPAVSAADAAELSTDNLDFAFDLYPGVVTDETTNEFYSPYSASLALAMTYAGAAGETATQMATALHFDLPPAALHPAFDALDLALASRAKGQPGTNGQGFALNIADSLWGEQSLTFQKPFLDTLAVDYGSGLRLTDFAGAPEAARAAINGWVSQETDEKIPTLLPDGTITSDTRFVLVNAIYFDAAWASQFQATKTKNATFTRNDGTTVQASEMSQTALLTYQKGANYQAVELPYAGNQTSMVVVLPAAGQFASVEKGLSGTFASGVFSGLQAAGVTLSLPKFTIHAPTFSIAKRLQALGMTDAFNNEKANFTGMLSSTEGPLWLADVVQQAFVAVDENGTQAAAATAVIGVGNAAPGLEATVDVNRPFFFIIRDIPTNTALFVGRVMDPTQ